MSAFVMDQEPIEKITQLAESIISHKYKKLTFKAFRSAKELSRQLSELYAA